MRKPPTTPRYHGVIIWTERNDGAAGARFAWRATTLFMPAGCTSYEFTCLIDTDEPLESPDSLTYGGESI